MNDKLNLKEYKKIFQECENIAIKKSNDYGISTLLKIKFAVDI